MTSAKSLSILVPTYGRAAHLEALLRTIAADSGAQDVTVLVSDNASPDDTVSAVRALQGEFPGLDLRLHVQPENRGAQGNIAWLVENAPATEYVWLLCDDDRPLPGAIGYVLEALAEASPTVLHLPHRFDSMAGFSDVHSPCPATIETFPSSRQLLLTYHGWLSFGSASVVRRSALIEAVRLAPTENPWGPHIWYVVAGRDGTCAVAARHLVHGGGVPGWLDKVALYLTTCVIDAFDEGFRLVVNEHDYGRVLDARYGQLGGAQYWQEAPIDELLAVVTRFPTSRLLRHLLCALGRQQGRRDVLLAVDRAVRDAGDDAAAARLVAEGERRFAAGDVAGAADALRAALQEHPTRAEAWSDLGVVLHAQGVPGAGEAFARALEVEPDHADALLNRACWGLSLGDCAQAAKDARQLLALVPDHQHAREILAAAGA